MNKITIKFSLLLIIVFLNLKLAREANSINLKYFYEEKNKQKIISHAKKYGNIYIKRKINKGINLRQVYHYEYEALKMKNLEKFEKEHEHDLSIIEFSCTKIYKELYVPTKFTNINLKKHFFKILNKVHRDYYEPNEFYCRLDNSIIFKDLR